jgi:hypothetical protein
VGKASDRTSPPEGEGLDPNSCVKCNEQIRLLFHPECDRCSTVTITTNWNGGRAELPQTGLLYFLFTVFPFYFIFYSNLEVY